MRCYKVDAMPRFSASFLYSNRGIRTNLSNTKHDFQQKHNLMNKNYITNYTCNFLHCNFSPNDPNDRAHDIIREKFSWLKSLETYRFTTREYKICVSWPSFLFLTPEPFKGRGEIQKIRNIWKIKDELT